MPKITFLGAGSTVFAKSVLGDCMLTPALAESHIALYDIDRKRLAESRMMLDNLNANINAGRARITSHCGPARRRAALKGADFVVNAVQIGGYEPATVIDFEIPKKYGLRQTIADTLGIGGLFRSLRTIPFMLAVAREMADLCPDAWLLNYANPQATLVGAVLQATGVRAVGLCHSVQCCARGLLRQVGMLDAVTDLQWEIAGINHMGWLLSIRDGKKDLYPEIKRRAKKKVRAARKPGGEKFGDMVRLDIMRHFGYYVTESSEHSAEYMPYWIKSRYPELIEEFNIPLDEYPRRCIGQIAHWKARSADLVNNRKLDHKRTAEYGSWIMEAVVTNRPCRIHGNVMNHGLITNLPAKAVVEVACLVDRTGIQPTVVGALPEQLAALNRTNINTQLLTIEAALTRRKDKIYQAAMLDPHTAAELPLDQIRALCDDLIAAHGDYLPRYT